MSNTRKEWTKPQLIVLGRSNPEESVLLKCRTMSQGCDKRANFAAAQS